VVRASAVDDCDGCGGASCVYDGGVVWGFVWKSPGDV
jgi:hypothetical protein